MRNASDEYIRTNIFMNADLSPAAAKIAYESRKRRRERQQQQQEQQQLQH